MKISCSLVTEDYSLFLTVINQGIDSHLEGFTKSCFNIDKSDKRLLMNFDKSEIHILLRRLREQGTEYANEWADDIENCKDEG